MVQRDDAALSVLPTCHLFGWSHSMVTFHDHVPADGRWQRTNTAWCGRSSCGGDEQRERARERRPEEGKRERSTEYCRSAAVPGAWDTGRPTAQPKRWHVCRSDRGCVISSVARDHGTDRPAARPSSWTSPSRLGRKWWRAPAAGKHCSRVHGEVRGGLCEQSSLLDPTPPQPKRRPVQADLDRVGHLFSAAMAAVRQCSEHGRAAHRVVPKADVARPAGDEAIGVSLQLQQGLPTGDCPQGLRL